MIATARIHTINDVAITNYSGSHAVMFTHISVNTILFCHFDFHMIVALLSLFSVTFCTSSLFLLKYSLIRVSYSSAD